MRKLSFAILAILLISVLIASAVSAAAKEIKIGGLFALSGKAAPVGITSQQVAKMVVDDINKKGGINGSKLVLVVEDTRSEPGQAAIAMKKLIEKDKVVAICGPTSTGEIMACLNTAEAGKTPVVACVGGAAPVTPIRPWIFKSPQKTSSAVVRIYKYFQAKKIKKIGVLSASDKFGQEGAELLSSLAKTYGISIVENQTFDPNDTDMSVQVGKIAAAKPQAMVVWTIGPAGGIVTKNARQLKVPFQVVQCHGQPDPVYLKVAGAAAEGTIMPSTKLMVAAQLPASDPQKKVEQAFVKAFKANKLGELSTHSGYAWDAVQIIANGIKKAGTNPDKLRAAIENTKNYVGVSGVYNMSKSDHTGLDYSSLVMVTVKNGKWVMLK